MSLYIYIKRHLILAIFYIYIKIRALWSIQNITQLRYLNKKVHSRYEVKSSTWVAQTRTKRTGIQDKLWYKSTYYYSIRSGWKISDHPKADIRERWHKPIWLITWSNAKRFYNKVLLLLHNIAATPSSCFGSEIRIMGRLIDHTSRFRQQSRILYPVPAG
jgi:hypothetical protein